MPVPSSLSPSRRTVLKSVAVGGVALTAWSVPVVEKFAMTASTAEAVSAPGPSSSIDPTSITAPPDPTTPVATATVTTTDGGGGLGAGDPGGAAAQAAGRGQLAATGVNVPVGTATAIAAGAIATGVAAVVLGNRAGATTTSATADVLSRAPRRH